MSPDRQQAPSSEVKPYSRQSTPDATPSKQRSTDIAHEETAQHTEITSKPGFPTYTQYKQLEANYLAGLQPHRREKALISQSLFDRIWAVLHAPDMDIETPQFRFWVRKKFTFGTIAARKPSKSSNTSTASADSNSEKSQTVLLHEKNLVAVREQIYDILCYSHGTSHHAGRDKTCAAVRQNYTWIPKELVAQFIKACPTCIAKKCGMKNSGNQSATYLLPSLRQYVPNADVEGGENGDFRSLGLERSFSATSSEPSSGSKISVWDSTSDSLRTSVPEIRLDRAANQSAPELLKSPSSLPMSREVSLYQGLPNGWQFRHDDLNIAQDEFVHHKSVSPKLSHSTGRVRLPRVPSIAPVVRELFTDPLIMTPPFQKGEIDPECILPPLVLPSQPSRAPSLPSLHIDPALFPLRDGDTPLHELPLIDAEIRSGALPSIHRAAAPPPINLRYLNSQKTIQAFLTLRDTHSLTPDSPLEGTPLASPAGSESSQLSSFPMMVTDSLSPANTALTTPTDDVATTGLDLDVALNAKGGMEAKGKTASLILGENASLEAVCGEGTSSVISL